MDRFIEIKNLVKDFSGRGILNRRTSAVRAVDRVSFNIDRNTVFGLVGESGCGKTTLVRSILYLDPPTSGEIRVDGVSLATLSSLTSLFMRNCFLLTDAQPLAGLSSLTHLDLTDCIHLTDVSTISEMTSLQYLSLKGCMSVIESPCPEQLFPVFRLEIV